MSGQGVGQPAPVSSLEVGVDGPYIKVSAGLLEHPKTLQLEAALNEPDPWRYLIRLWVWCLSHREDGNLGDLEAWQLARVCGYAGADAEGFAGALLEAGFLDGGEDELRVHGWEDIYRDLIRERAYWRTRKAEQRASKRGVPPVSPECPRGQVGDNPGTFRTESESESERNTKTKTDTGEPPAPSPEPKLDPIPYQDVVRVWNETAVKAGLATVQKLTESRRRTVKARVVEHGLDGVLVALARVADSPFLTGKVSSPGRDPFLASFDWVLAPSNFTKLVEGNYDARKPAPGGRPGNVHPFRTAGDSDTLGDQLRARSKTFNPDEAAVAAGGVK